MNEVWGADPLSDGAILAIEAIERSITVDLIATFEPQLVCCTKTDIIAELKANEKYAPFDYLPVRSDGLIIGLLPLGGLRAESTDPGMTAEGAMSSLNQSIMTTSSSGVLHYIEEAEASPCRLVLRQTKIETSGAPRPVPTRHSSGTPNGGSHSGAL
jgi:hypothetical protein